MRNIVTNLHGTGGQDEGAAAPPGHSFDQLLQMYTNYAETFTCRPSSS